MVREALLVSLIMLGLFVDMLCVEARWVNFRVILLIERKVLDGFHNISLTEVDKGFDVVYKPLMLYACWLVHLGFDLYWILVNFGPQFCRYFNLLMSLHDVVLDQQEHSFVRGEKYLILMNVHVL